MLKKYRFFLAGCLVFLLAALFFFSLYRSQQEPAIFSYTTTDFALSTFITQELYGPDAEKAGQEVSQLVFQFENTYSIFREQSVLSQVNAAAGQAPVRLESEVYALLKRAYTLSLPYAPYFDLTIEPLSRLWNVTASNPQIPSQQQIDERLPLVDASQIVFDDQAQTLYLPTAGMGIDPGGILKGALVDEICAVYKRYNLTGGYLSVGGNLYVFGQTPQKQPFVVSLRVPATKGEETLARLTLSNQIIATTATYERSFEKDGVLYHHVLDPRTGWPAQSDLASVSIIGEDGMLCDLLSTTFFVMGKDAVIQLLNTQDLPISVVLVSTDGTVWISQALVSSYQTQTDAPLIVIETGEVIA